ncbi:DUF2202 domain-containing protein [Streptomyces sp. NPDC086080]|uniref:DUF2202 domain-containing protein n=1 Tax=Streptomyces sp. NPDC086080 TaxID=3365748 RepID=UPI0037D66468
MRRNIKIATAVTASALAIGGVLAAGPVAADPGGAAGTVAAQTTSRSAPPSAEDLQRQGDRGHQQGQGHQGGQGEQGQHRGGDAGPRQGGGGDCDGGVLAEQGTLTAEQKDTLAGMAEEEKLAHDLYTAFGERYDVRIFERIAESETQHLTAVRTLLDRYDVTDPTAGKPAGEFADPDVQASYDRLLAQGEESLSEALKVGRTFEADDIDALTEALSGLTAPDARQVYGNLLAGSERHQEAFDRWITGE